MKANTLKTRVIALALTALMVLGVLPMAIFATGAAAASNQSENLIDANIKFQAPTASDVSNVQFWNDFNALSVGGEFATTGMMNSTAGVGVANGGTLSVVDDGNGGAAIQNKANSVAHTFFYYYDRWAAQTGNSGTNIVLTADLKMPTADEVQAADIFAIGDRAGFSFSPLFLDTDGTIYLGYRDGHVYYANTGSDSDFVTSYVSGALPDAMKVGGAIAKLSADKFTNVALVVDVVANSFKVYVDGVDVTGNLTLFNNTKKAEIVNKGYVNGFGVAQVRFLLQSKAVTDVGAIFDNTLMYIGNTYEGNWSYGTTTKAGIVEDVTEYVPVTPDAVKSKFGDSALLYYNDFTNAAQGGGKLNLNANAVAADGALNVAHSGGNSQFWPFGENWGNGTYSEHSGESFVISIDAKMPEGGVGHAGALWTANSRDVSGGAFFSPVLYNSDGALYLGYNGSYAIDTHEASFSNASLSQTGGGKIGQLSSTEYTNIAVVMNPAPSKNTFSVYVDGACVAKDLKMFSDAKLSAIAATSYANGWIPRQIFVCNETQNSGNLNVTLDNLMAYVGDSYDAAITTQVEKEWATPTAAQLTAKYGTSNILYYNDFTNAAQGGGKLNLNANAVAADGALNVAHSSGNTQFWPFGENWGGGYGSGYSGSSFVIAFDAKMPEGGVGHAGAFWTANSRDVSGGAFFSPVLYDADGSIYLGYNGNNCIETHEGSFSAATLSGTNKVGGKIGQLSADKYTNIAVVMNPAPSINTFSVYVDGVCVAKDLRMFSDAKLSAIASTAYTNGWIPRQIFVCNETNGLGKLNVTLDNLAAYVGDSYIETYNQTGFYNGTAEGGDLNGYVPQLGVIKYYENGVLKTNTTSADGLLTIDENGTVKYNGENVLSMADLYTINDYGQIVARPGVAAVYVPNSILGATAEVGGDVFVDVNVAESATEIFESIPEGTTGVLNGDVTFADEEVVFANNTSIDLNGNTITVKSIAAFGALNIVDSGASKGLIVVEDGFVAENVSAEAVISYNADRGGYESYNVKKAIQEVAPTVNAETGKVDFKFRPTLDNNKDINKALLGDATALENSGLALRIKVEGMKDGSVAASVDAQIAAASVVEAYANDKAFNLKIGGNFANYDEIVITYYFTAIGGSVACVVNTVTYNPNV